MEKINIAELLKDCPKGMELDCVIYNNVEFEGISDNKDWPIKISVEGYPEVLNPYGCISYRDYTKCVIFPKGKTSWEGFVPPCQFKDGDIVFTHANCLKVGVGNTWISIFKERRNDGVATYVDYAEDGSDYYSDLDGDKALLCMESDILRQRFATEEEKEKLFKAINDNGYKWNSETKTLEKLIKPIFKAGNKIRSKNKKDECFYILNVDEDKHKYVLNIKGYCLEFKDQDHYELVSDTSIEPKFKVGDKVRYKNNHNVVFTITNIEKDYYACGTNKAFWFDDQDKYELVPKKFDITTLKPFDKVLVRDNSSGRWDITFYELYDNTNSCYPHRTLGGNIYKYCIPYEGNEHLTGLVKECDNYYKTWTNEED